jgi:hypothetical protein
VVAGARRRILEHAVADARSHLARAGFDRARSGLVFLLHLVLFWGGLMLIRARAQAAPRATVILFGLAGLRLS